MFLHFENRVADPVLLLQIQLLEFNPEADSIKVLASYLHGQEVWHLAPHPQDTQILATISNQGQPHMRFPQRQNRHSPAFNSNLPQVVLSLLLFGTSTQRPSLKRRLSSKPAMASPGQCCGMHRGITKPSVLRMDAGDCGTLTVQQM